MTFSILDIISLSFLAGYVAGTGATFLIAIWIIK